MTKPILTAERLRELLIYHPATGIFKRIQRIGNSTCEGELAGGIDGQGYSHIRVSGGRYKAHRLAWLYMTGRWPTDQIDHINRIRLDNRWANLREASNADNQQNCGAYKRRRHNLPPGVWQNKPTDKYHAKVYLNKKVHYCGTFDTPDAAHQAYLAMKRELHAFCTA